MNKPRLSQRCLVWLTAFAILSCFVVLQGSFLVTLTPSSSVQGNTSKTAVQQYRKHRMFRRYMEKDDECTGKENILNILQNNIDVKRCKVATVETMTMRETPLQQVFGMTTCRFEDLCPTLPQWNYIQNSYGSLPTIIGTDSSCSTRMMKETATIYTTTTTTMNNKRRSDYSTPLEQQVQIIGLFSNAGSDLLATTLHMNYPNLQVQSLNYSTAMNYPQFVLQEEEEEQDILTIVVVRDPFRWMAAMCMSDQGVSWLPAPNQHCPNLVPSGKDHALAKRLKTYSVVVTPSGHRYASLADLWSSFYQPFLTEDVVVGRKRKNRFVVIRYEDILYHLESVLDAILACVGDVTTQTKNSRLPYGAVSEMTSKPGRGRYAGMTNEDIQYAKKAIPSWMLEKLRYRPIPNI